MLGLGESVNVSVAAAVILFEAQRQRAAAGLYAHPRLAPEELERTLFEWCYPDVARALPRARPPVPAARPPTARCSRIRSRPEPLS